MMKAILLIDHGSVRAEANHMLECMGALVQQLAGDETIVRIAHMELAGPSVEEGFAACVAAGATEVVAFPYMLSPGKHSTRDIPRMVSGVAASFPDVRFTVTPAFGVNERLAEAVLERVGVAVVEPAVSAPECRSACMRPAGTPERYCGDGCRALVGEPASTISG
ncbi:MAG TPA: CbiX/SirB N-terminal domain-containing protein [Gemmatimonadaceae bacterium]